MSKRKLDKKPAAPKPAFVMADPNDDAAAFGWTLGKLRYQGEKDDKGETWPGTYVFQVPTPYEVRQIYGHNIEFINPGFVQLLLDAEPDIRAGAEKVRATGYTPEALKKYSKTIVKVFHEKILPQIVERFEDITPLVAEFYAARLAHIDKFGVED